MAAALEASGDYRALLRLKPRNTINAPDGSPTKAAIFLDLETTGLDPLKEEIIEMAMISFTYSVDGRIFELGAPFDRLRHPASPISQQITAITGITNEIVRGKSIDPAEVDAFVKSAALVIAHNAAFDRPYAQRFCSLFACKPWACSMSQIPWEAEGLAGSKRA